MNRGVLPTHKGQVTIFNHKITELVYFEVCANVLWYYAWWFRSCLNSQLCAPVRLKIPTYGARYHPSVAL